ncbi:hypothetical protein G7054_g4883 [Neopestalotiopsis clavispora]|nr:hypothetical protein E8E14_012348 [Neopestalotiopsis sp. 37M]KAF7536027.1 hypothetical protein G7054_g4883 [Neopestalotiopsis clavispora]
METPSPSGVSFRKLDSAKSEIRLLELQAAENIEEPPVCRIVNVQLTDKTEYVAISCLSAETEQEPVILNNKRILVPATLGQVLRHVRAVFLDPAARPDRSRSPANSKEKKGPPSWLVQALKHVKSIFPESPRGRFDEAGEGPLLVWLEPFCVDRRNPTETAQQLTHMAMVYRSAQIVVGWLGLKTELTDVALDVLQQVEAVFPPHFGEPEDKLHHPENYSPQHEWLRKLEHLWEFGTDGVYYSALQDFSARPLFHRTWLIDEIATARYPAFLIGDRICSWKQVLVLNRMLEEISNESAVFPAGLRPVAQSWPLGTIYTMLKHYEERKRKENEEDHRNSALKQYEKRKRNEQAAQVAGAGALAYSEMKEKARKGSVAASSSDAGS